MTVQEVAKIAGGYLSNLYTQASNVQLEEVEKTGDIWELTMSYDISAVPNSFVGLTSKNFKKFKINDKNGEVISMKMRL
jgi:hypothetical protein